jgi:rhodanese-related sulfurtransferase/molybdopterin-guanine dinucleotide biosynthesis protein A
MGRDKALLPIDGVAMAARVAVAMRAAGAVDVYAVGGDAAGLARVGLRVVPDDEPGAGPFPATLTALRAATAPVVLVASCDLREPDPSAMAATVGALEASAPERVGAVPVVAGHHQWTHAAWRIDALPILAAARADGTASLKRAAATVSITDVHGLPPAALADADTPADLPGGHATGGVEPGSLPAMDVPEIDVAELAERRADGAALIDVREHAEYVEARVPGAHHIPLGQVVERVAEVPTDGTVYVICARGGRSARAVEHYRAQGIDAVNVAGGTLGWIDAGLPTDNGARNETTPG